MSSFAAAQELGGVVVRIGGDISGLRASEQQARAVAQGIDRIRAVVKVGLDFSAVKTGLMQLQAMARALPPIKIPVQLVNAGGGGGGFGGGMGLLSGGSRMPPQGITINSGQRMLSGPQSTALSAVVNSGGWTSGTPYTPLGGGPMNYSGFSGSRMGAPSAAGAPPAGGGATRSATGGMGIIGKFLAAEAIGHMIGGGARDLSQQGQLQSQIISGQGASLTGYQLAMADGRGSGPAAILGNTPIVGQMIKGGFDLYTSGILGSAAIQDAENNKNATEIERKRAREDAVLGFAGQSRSMIAGAATRDAMASRDPTRALEAQLSDQSASLEATLQKAEPQLSGRVAPGLRAALAEDQASQRRALSMQITASRESAAGASATGVAQASFALAASGSGTGSDDTSFAMGQASARTGMLGQHAAEIDGEGDTANRVSILRRQAAEVAALDAQQAQARVERERDTASRITGIRAEGHAAALAADHRGFEAESDAFESAAEQRISAARNLSAEEQHAIVGSIAAQRVGLAKQQQERSFLTTIGFASSANVAELQSQGRNREAARTNFDAATATGLFGVDHSQWGAYIASRDRVRAAMVSGQEHDRAIMMTGIRGRAEAARFNGAGMSQTAGLAAMVAQQQMELQGAEASDRPAIAAAQLEEMKAMKADLSRPRTFASEFDPSRQAVGGPGGDVARDSLGVLRSIDNRITALTRALANPAVLNN